MPLAPYPPLHERAYTSSHSQGRLWCLATHTTVRLGASRIQTLPLHQTDDRWSAGVAE